MEVRNLEMDEEGKSRGGDLSLEVLARVAPRTTRLRLQSIPAFLFFINPMENLTRPISIQSLHLTIHIQNRHIYNQSQIRCHTASVSITMFVCAFALHVIVISPYHKSRHPDAALLVYLLNHNLRSLLFEPRWMPSNIM